MATRYVVGCACPFSFRVNDACVWLCVWLCLCLCLCLCASCLCASLSVCLCLCQCVRVLLRLRERTRRNRLWDHEATPCTPKCVLERHPHHHRPVPRRVA